MQTLDSLVSLNSGVNLNRIQENKDENGRYYKVIKTFNLTASGIEGNLEEIFASDISQANLTSIGNILIRLTPPLNAFCITKEYEGCIFPSLIATIKVKPQVLLPEYLTYFLNSKLSQTFFQKRSQGTNAMIIGLKDLRELKIHVPTLKKQKQIVQFLQESTKKIALLQEKIQTEVSLQNARFKQLFIKGAKS